ncbi:hypothetical protein TDB9533_03403 [Thalassocella blandensis]|nr:hypothetical protein TDB9533_03403 [Thalassocella blandensis]
MIVALITRLENIHHAGYGQRLVEDHSAANPRDANSLALKPCVGVFDINCSRGLIQGFARYFGCNLPE